jgi:hypothetical protein
LLDRYFPSTLALELLAERFPLTQIFYFLYFLITALLNMKNIALLAIIFASSGALAASGPTSIGPISIGMSKQHYISSIGIAPFDCTTLKDNNGEIIRSEQKFLTTRRKTLCVDARYSNMTGIVDSIQVSGLSYDVVEANFEASKFVESIGNSIKAIFFKDRLISLEIYAPKVSLDILSTKYGSPKLFDKTKLEICKNKIGNEIKNQVGTVDGVWTNKQITAILRNELNPPRKTCTDGFNMQYYIIEERKEMELIEEAIKNFTAEMAKTNAKDSPF